MDQITDTKLNHVWRKIVWQTDPDLHPLGPRHYAAVYCCEEANGYAVWYVRRLKEDGRSTGSAANGDYLLSYFSKADRDIAIERAVLIANSAADPDAMVASIDALTAGAQKI